MSTTEDIEILERGGSIVDLLLREQQSLAAVERFAEWHDSDPLSVDTGSSYRALMPVTPPSPSQQYAFEVDLDQCSGCKACVVACHTMNGLDDHETWRRVGTLLGGTDRRTQHVTTACHHCVEPGCLLGCPVKAYEKDPLTGIVRHLDDQCIGCKYCTMMCPYEVPQYNKRLGIVRKCDMCRQRLTVGEAPACVQACPNAAIRITLVEQKTVRVTCGTDGATLVPTAPLSSITLPTTVYRGTGKAIASAGPVSSFSMDALAESHWPLALMLVLTQASVGTFLVTCVALLAQLTGSGSVSDVRESLSAAWLVGFVGLNLASLHLGQPLRAWRVFLGLRTSWLSREAVILGAYMGGLTTLTGIAWLSGFGWVSEALEPWLPSIVFITALATVICGIAGWFCSAQIYIVTRRKQWRPVRTITRFGGTSLVAGLFIAAVPSVLPSPSTLAGLASFFLGLKLAWELRILFLPSSKQDLEDHRSKRLAWRSALWTSSLRISSGIAAIVVVVLSSQVVKSDGESSPAWLGFAALLALVGECCERLLYFQTVVHDRMPQAMPSMLVSSRSSP